MRQLFCAFIICLASHTFAADPDLTCGLSYTEDQISTSVTYLAGTTGTVVVRVFTFNTNNRPKNWMTVSNLESSKALYVRLNDITSTSLITRTQGPDYVIATSPTIQLFTDHLKPSGCYGLSVHNGSSTTPSVAIRGN